MRDTVVLVTKIAAMFLVMLIGYAARRRGRVDASTTARLGSLTSDVCLPALTFAQLLATVDADRLRAAWIVPLLGAGVILLGLGAGKLLARVFATPAEAPTFAFLTAMANWIYLPLPIVQAIHGSAGVEALLLANVGAQLVLWTAGVATLRGGRLDAAGLRALLGNPGLIAAAAGILGALSLPRDAGALAYPGRVILEAITIIGSLTIPLSLLVTGAQLGAASLELRPSRATVGVVLVRLLAVPLIVLALIFLAARAGLPLPHLPITITLLVAAMPVAVSCSILTARYGQDTRLASQGIFHSTVWSVLSVPAMMWILHRMI